MAQTGYNPCNPPEPSARYKISVSASPDYGYTSGSDWYDTGEQAWISTSSYSPDYTFKYWTKNGAKYTESNSFYYTVETENVKQKDAAFYNLNGQRVMIPRKGLYIVNGKKVIIK